MKTWLIRVAWLVLALNLVMGWMSTPVHESFDTHTFGTFPVLENGRLKPLDTVARTHLLMFRGKQTLKIDDETIPPIQWLLDMAVHPKKADNYPVFRLYHDSVKTLIGLPKESPKYVSFSRLAPYLPVIVDQAETVADIEPQLRNPYERAIYQLYQHMDGYMQLRNSLRPIANEHLSDTISSFGQAVEKGRPLLKHHGESALDDPEANALSAVLRYFKQLKQSESVSSFRLIPPQNDLPDMHQWQTLSTSLLVTLKPQPLHSSVPQYATLFHAYREGDVDAFNAAAKHYDHWLRISYPDWMHNTRLESRFNHFAPFYESMKLYILGFILILLAWLRKGKHPDDGDTLRAFGLGLIVLGFMVHTFGLGMRMWIQGRPPITNLYTSAVFVGWFSVFLGALLERVFKNGVGAVTASVIGFLTLIIAHHLSLSGDTLEMMQAVLDSNFWLATHVITINIGYGATIVAGILAHVFLFKRVLSKTFDDAEKQSLAKMVFGANCVAILFMVIGTVLGGVWADQSWGRFWGWDPKENGALLIILWLAIVLHARFKYINARGLMVMSVFSNIVTAFSWFGVNMLGIGLHSYGFMEKTFLWLMIFIFVQLVVMWLGLVPERSKRC